MSINDQTEPKSVENNTENHLPIEQERPNQEEQQQQQQPPKEDKIPNETLRVIPSIRIMTLIYIIFFYKISTFMYKLIIEY